MTNPSKPVLPVRPRRRIDEWSETHLVDVARANGLARPWRNHLELVRSALPAVGPMLAPNVQPPSLLKDGSPLFGGLEIPLRSRIGRAGNIRYCPACLTEAPYVRSRWRVVGYEVCGKHACLLKNDIVEPAYSPKYKAPGRSHYGSATSAWLWDGAVCTLPEGLTAHRRIWLPFEKLDQDEGSESKATALALAWALVLQRLIDVVTGSDRGGVRDDSAGDAAARRGSWLVQQGSAFEPGWAGYMSLLAATPAVRTRRNMRRALAALIAGDDAQRSVFSLLPLDDMLARLDAATPELGAVAKAWSNKLQGFKATCLSIYESSLEVGVATTRFESYVREHGIQPARVVFTGRKRHQYFTREQVHAVRRYFLSLVSVEELVESQGLSWPGYFSLRTAGYLNPRIEAGRRFVMRSELGTLLTRLEEASRPVSEATRPLTPLFGDEVFGPNVRQQVSKGLVDGVLQGSIPVFRDLSESHFAAFKVHDTIAVQRDQLRLFSLSSSRVERAAGHGQMELFA